MYDILDERCMLGGDDLSQAAQYTIVFWHVEPGIEKENMALSDQTLVCRDCNQEFIFTVGEQEFYASHQLTNTPSRCPSCRAARKGQGGYGGRGGSREPRQMYTATCSSCGARPRCLSSHEATSLFIVAIATRLRGVAVVASVDRV